MPKAVLNIYRVPSEEPPREIIRIDAEASKILEQVQRETGLSYKAIASEFIKACAEDYEVKIIK